MVNKVLPGRFMMPTFYTYITQAKNSEFSLINSCTLGSFSSEVVKSLCFAPAACLFKADLPMLPMSISFRRAGVKCERRVCEVVKCEVRCEIGCDWSVASGSPRTLPNGN